MTVQQEALINGSSLKCRCRCGHHSRQRRFRPYTLSALKIADTLARQQNLSEISAAILTQVWADLGAYSLQAPSRPGNPGPSEMGREPRGNPRHHRAEGRLLRRLQRNKQPLFVRNLQVYFAKRRWPADSNEARQWQDFTEG